MGLTHISLKHKELATRTSSIDTLTKIGEAFKVAELWEPIDIYFEFASPDELLLFCRTIKTMPYIQSIEQAEARKSDIEKEIADLVLERDKLAMEFAELRDKLARRKKT